MNDGDGAGWVVGLIVGGGFAMTMFVIARDALPVGGAWTAVGKPALQWVGILGGLALLILFGNDSKSESGSDGDD